MPLKFNIDQWSVWPPLTSPTEASGLLEERLSHLPKLLKRRLSPLAKTVFASVIPCLGDQAASIPVVFSSSHGELERSLNMMQDIENGEAVSPTAFSLSVHNAIAGLFAIAFGNKLESTVIAPGDEGIVAALLESLAMLEEGLSKVIIVFYDAPLPAFYPYEPFKLNDLKTQAISLCLSQNYQNLQFELNRVDMSGESELAQEQASQLPLLIDFLMHQQTDLYLPNARYGWHIKRHVETA